MQRPQPEHRSALMRGMRAAILECSPDRCFHHKSMRLFAQCAGLCCHGGAGSCRAGQAVVIQDKQFVIPDQQFVIPAPDQVRGFNIRDPVLRHHWIAGQARNDKDS